MSETTKNETKREGVLRKVQALLDKATSTTFEPERDALLAKADEMMARFAIEEFELGKADPKASVKAELRTVDLPHPSDWSVSYSLERMFCDLCRHVGVMVGGSSMVRNDEDAFVTRMKVVGYPSDLDYVTMMFLNLQLHFLGRMDPKADASKSDLDNFVALWESGNDYRAIWRKMEWPWRTVVREHYCSEHGSVEKAECECECFSCEGLRKHAGSGDLVAAERKRLHSLRKGYHEACKAEGRTPMKGLKGDVYRKSYIAGYVARIGTRLQEMRAARDEASKGHEVVIVSMRDDLREAFFDFFPDRRPHPAECECESCHFAKCNDETCTRTRCVEYRKNLNKPVRARSFKEPVVDARAYGFGSSVANGADLGGSGVGGGSKGEL